MNVRAESLHALATAAGAPLDLTGEGVVRWVTSMLRKKVVREELEAMKYDLVVAQQRAELAEKNDKISREGWRAAEEQIAALTEKSDVRNSSAYGQEKERLKWTETLATFDYHTPDYQEPEAAIQAFMLTKLLTVTKEPTS